MTNPNTPPPLDNAMRKLKLIHNYDMEIKKIQSKRDKEMGSLKKFVEDFGFCVVACDECHGDGMELSLSGGATRCLRCNGTGYLLKIMWN